MRGKTYVLRGISLVIAAFTAAACSSEEKKQEFTVPKSLCGVSVPSEALSDLLPSSGGKLTVDKLEGSSEGDGLCSVTVDGNEVLNLDRERIDAGDSARTILRSRLNIQQQKTAEDGSIAYADSAAVSVVHCRGTGVAKEDISTLIKVLGPGRKDESAMKNLISGYTAALKKQDPCRQGS